MEVSTFSKDLFELASFAEQLEDYIRIEQNFVEGSLVIALSSRFGSGKSTFLRMWKERLESQKDEAERTLVISLNAWESDYYGDPLFAIMSALIGSLQEKGESVQTLISAAKDVGWFATALGGQLVTKFVGIDAVAAGDLAEKKRARREVTMKLPKDTFSMYQARHDAMKQLRSAIGGVVEQFASKVLFLIDELDRCRPDYAISYLETIKHIFNTNGAVFVLAADRRHLENSAKTAFGVDLDFDEYLRKFVHREVSLPPISKSGYERLASSYVSHFLQRDGVRRCYMHIDPRLLDQIVELVGGLKLTPRQAQEMFRIVGHVTDTSEQKEGHLYPLLSIGTLAMAAFKLGNPRVFQLLGTRSFEPREALAFLQGVLGDERAEWWLCMLLQGNGLKVGRNTSHASVLRDAGAMAGVKESTVIERLSQFDNGWGECEGRCAQIYEKIQHVSKWD